MRENHRFLPLLREAAWLLLAAAASFLLAGVLLGTYRPLLPGRVLDLQLHNTYLILDSWLALLPLFLAAALPLTWARATQAGYRQRATNVVLTGLGVLAALVVALLGYWVWEEMRG